MIAGNGEYGPGIGTGYTGEKSGSKKCVKNRVKSEIVLVRDVPGSFLSDPEWKLTRIL